MAGSNLFKLLPETQLLPYGLSFIEVSYKHDIGGIYLVCSQL